MSAAEQTRKFPYDDPAFMRAVLARLKGLNDEPEAAYRPLGALAGPMFGGPWYETAKSPWATNSQMYDRAGGIAGELEWYRRQTRGAR